MNFRIYELIPKNLFKSISSTLIKENDMHYFNLKLKNNNNAKVTIDHKNNDWYINGKQIVKNDRIIQKNIPLIEQNLNFKYKPFVKIITEGEKLQGTKFYQLPDGTRKQILNQPRPNRMKSPGIDASLRREDRPICYGDCSDLFKEKYGEEKGEKTYETLFINSSNNFGWTVAANIQKEKAVMLNQLGYDRPNDLHDVAYYPLWKEWITKKVEKHKYHDFLKESKIVNNNMTDKEKIKLQKTIRAIIKEELNKSNSENLDEGWKQWVISTAIVLSSFGAPHMNDLLASTPKNLKPTMTIMRDTGRPEWAKKDAWKQGDTIYVVGFAQDIDLEKASLLAKKNAQTKALLFKYGNNKKDFKLDPKIRYSPIPMSFNDDFYDYTETNEDGSGKLPKGVKVYVLGKISQADFDLLNTPATGQK